MLSERQRTVPKTLALLMGQALIVISEAVIGFYIVGKQNHRLRVPPLTRLSTASLSTKISNLN